MQGLKTKIKKYGIQAPNLGNNFPDWELDAIERPLKERESRDALLYSEYLFQLDQPP